MRCRRRSGRDRPARVSPCDRHERRTSRSSQRTCPLKDRTPRCCVRPEPRSIPSAEDEHSPVGQARGRRSRESWPCSRPWTNARLPGRRAPPRPASPSPPRSSRQPPAPGRRRAGWPCAGSRSTLSPGRDVRSPDRKLRRLRGHGVLPTRALAPSHEERARLVERGKRGPGVQLVHRPRGRRERRRSRGLKTTAPVVSFVASMTSTLLVAEHGSRAVVERELHRRKLRHDRRPGRRSVRSMKTRPASPRPRLEEQESRASPRPQPAAEQRAPAGGTIESRSAPTARSAIDSPTVTGARSA